MFAGFQFTISEWTERTAPARDRERERRRTSTRRSHGSVFHVFILRFYCRLAFATVNPFFCTTTNWMQLTRNQRTETFHIKQCRSSCLYRSNHPFLTICLCAVFCVSRSVCCCCFFSSCVLFYLRFCQKKNVDSSFFATNFIHTSIHVLLNCVFFCVCVLKIIATLFPSFSSVRFHFNFNFNFDRPTV